MKQIIFFIAVVFSLNGYSQNQKTNIVNKWTKADVLSGTFNIWFYEEGHIVQAEPNVSNSIVISECYDGQIKSMDYIVDYNHPILLKNPKLAELFCEYEKIAKTEKDTYFSRIGLSMLVQNYINTNGLIK